MTTKRTREATAKVTARVRKRVQYHLSLWIGRDVAEKYIESLQTKVLDRAVHAVDLLGRSSKAYMFDPQIVQPGPILQEHSACKVKDIATWRTISSSDTLGALYCLYPGLVRKREPDEDDLTLIQPTLLGYKSLELQPKLDSSRSTSPSKQELPRLTRELSDGGVSARHLKTLRKKSPPKHPYRPPETKPLPPSKDSTASRLAKYIGLNPPAPAASPHPDPRGPSKNTPRRGSKSTASATSPVDSQRYPGPGGPMREQQSISLPATQTFRTVPSEYLDSGGSRLEPSHGSSFPVDDQRLPLYDDPEQYRYEDAHAVRELAGLEDHRRIT